MHISDQAAEATQGKARRCHILFCGQNTVRMLKGSMYAPRHALTFGLRTIETLSFCCRHYCRAGCSTFQTTQDCNLADRNACCAHSLRCLYHKDGNGQTSSGGFVMSCWLSLSS